MSDLDTCIDYMKYDGIYEHLANLAEAELSALRSELSRLKKENEILIANQARLYVVGKD